MTTYVLVHGGWAGGWQFKAIDDALSKENHTVYRPTLTGLGERVHLGTPETSLDTHIMDIVNVFKYEELDDVVLLGYSYGGMVITGVAEHMAEQIKHLVYLDAFVPKDGQSLGDLLGEGVMQFLQEAADAYGDGWKIPHDPPDAHLRTSHPMKPGLQTISISNPKAQALERTFIHCTKADEAMEPILAPIVAKANEVKSADDWQYHEVHATHGEVWETHPDAISDILLEID